MTLLDAYALVALVGNEKAADEVEGLLRDRDTAITSVNLAEALDVLGRVHRLPTDELDQVVGPLLEETISVVAPGEAVAWMAAELRTRHYARRARALSLADCFLLASASQRRDEIATADPAIAAVARLEGIDLVPLPNREGARP